MLAAGHSVTLGDSRDPDVQVVVSAPADHAGANKPGDVDCVVR